MNGSSFLMVAVAIKYLPIAGLIKSILKLIVGTIPPFFRAIAKSPTISIRAKTMPLWYCFVPLLFSNSERQGILTTIFSNTGSIEMTLSCINEIQGDSSHILCICFTFNECVIKLRSYWKANKIHSKIMYS